MVAMAMVLLEWKLLMPSHPWVCSWQKDGQTGVPQNDLLSPPHHCSNLLGCVSDSSCA